MGFATLENVLYVTNYAQVGRGLEVGLQRMFLSVPAHATFGVVMGYFVGKAKFNRSRGFWLSLAGLLGAVFFHGTYDFFLFLKSYSFVGRDISEGLLAGGAIASFVVSLILSRKLIRYHQLISKQMFSAPAMKPVFTIRKATRTDIPLIRQLAFNVWPQTYSGIISAPQIDYMLEMMYSEKSLQQQMTEGAQFIVVYDNDQPAGFASYQLTSPGIFKLHKLYVLPSQQGKGTGRYIIDYISGEIRRQRATALQLQVNRRNKARDFYEKLGFTVIREIDLDIGNGYVMDDYIMEKKI
jgi:ribosomal protein S18 acetylase RimI-like enzyme